MKHQQLDEKELQYLKRFRRVAKDWPASLKGYVIDGGCIFICKIGASSDDILEQVNIPLGSGCVITDLHDDDPQSGVRPEAA